MASLFDTDLEGIYPPTGWSEAGTAASINISTVIARSGTQSLRVTTATDLQAWLTNNIADSQVHVARFYVNLPVAPSGTFAMYEAANASGSAFITITSGRIIRASWAGVVNVNGPTLNLNQWYRIDLRAISGPTTTVTIDWQVDGVAQTQCSRTQAAANMTVANIGVLSARTVDVYFDDLRATDTSTDYPLGPPLIAIATYVYPLPGIAPGAANNSVISLKPSAQRPTGTGLTWGGLTGELVVAGAQAIGQGFAVSNDVESRVNPVPPNGAGTGAVPSAGRSVKATAAHSSGTGAATAAVGRGFPIAEIASGLGTANQPVASSTMTATSGQATGTGAASNASTTSVGGAHDPGLTIQMGM